MVSARLGASHLTILDPRLDRDRGLPNDHPYGTTESFWFVRPGDTLSFFELNSLRPLAMHVPVLSTARFKNATAALAMAALMNSELCVQQHSRSRPRDATTRAV